MLTGCAGTEVLWQRSGIKTRGATPTGKLGTRSEWSSNCLDVGASACRGCVRSFSRPDAAQQAAWRPAAHLAPCTLADQQRWAPHWQRNPQHGHVGGGGTGGAASVGGGGPPLRCIRHGRRSIQHRHPGRAADGPGGGVCHTAGDRAQVQAQGRCPACQGGASRVSSGGSGVPGCCCGRHRTCEPAQPAAAPQLPVVRQDTPGLLLATQPCTAASLLPPVPTLQGRPGRACRALQPLPAARPRPHGRPAVRHAHPAAQQVQCGSPPPTGGHARVQEPAGAARGCRSGGYHAGAARHAARR